MCDQVTKCSKTLHIRIYNLIINLKKMLPITNKIFIFIIQIKLVDR